MRTLVAAALAAATVATLAPTTATAVTASGEQPANVVTDPKGDYHSMNKAQKGPRASIDITKASAIEKAVNGVEGVSYAIKVQNLHGVNEAPDFRQRFLLDLHVDHGTTEVVVGFAIDQKVKVYHQNGDIKRCDKAVKTWDLKRNQVSVFVPHACVGNVVNRASVHSMLQNSKAILSTDRAGSFVTRTDI